MIETDTNLHQPSLTRGGRPPLAFAAEPGRLAVARVTKGVGAALGKTLAVDRDAALPDRLASLVERLHEGPLGQPILKPRRVA